MFPMLEESSPWKLLVDNRNAVKLVPIEVVVANLKHSEHGEITKHRGNIITQLVETKVKHSQRWRAKGRKKMVCAQ